MRKQVSMKSLAAAYRAGVKARRRGGRYVVPYGENRLAEKQYWIAGYEDAKRGCIDRNICPVELP